MIITIIIIMMIITIIIIIIILIIVIIIIIMIIMIITKIKTSCHHVTAVTMSIEAIPGPAHGRDSAQLTRTGVYCTV